MKPLGFSERDIAILAVGSVFLQSLRKISSAANLLTPQPHPDRSVRVGSRSKNWGSKNNK